MEKIKEKKGGGEKGERLPLGPLLQLTNEGFFGWVDLVALSDDENVMGWVELP